MSPFFPLLVAALLVVCLIYSSRAANTQPFKGIASIVPFASGKSTTCGNDINANGIAGAIVSKAFWNSFSDNNALCGKCLYTYMFRHREGVTNPIVGHCADKCGTGVNDILLSKESFDQLTYNNPGNGTADVSYVYDATCQ